MVRVKICGITNVEDALLACDLGADAIGLNFYSGSPRCISPFTASKIIRKLPPFVAPIGVFVNWQAAAVTALAKALALSAAQLHGDEPPKLAGEIARKVSVIKALHLGKGSALPSFARYRGTTAFLLDAPHSGQYGGTGQTTDWSLAHTAAKSHRILLAGGLTPENVAQAILAVRPYAVDVTSGVESKPGKKDQGKLRAFFDEVSRANQTLEQANHPVQAGSFDGDPFPGTWELDPETLDYQAGRPGRRALYVVEPLPDGLRFHLDGDDADGKPMKVSYGGALDGREQPIPSSDAVLVLTRHSKILIESALKRGGKIVDRWTREILPGRDTMRITQHVVRPDGSEARNVSIYRRKK
jgi:phosphoribosylanthranilate isomerase